MNILRIRVCCDLDSVRTVLSMAILTISAISISVLAVYVYVTTLVHRVISDVQPTPYMDEVFHISQAMNYCRGEIEEWNPKITTLPGLYIISAVVLRPLSNLLDRDVCDLYGLRYINLFGSLCNVVILYNLHSGLHFKGSLHTLQNLAAAINMSLFPVLYFFSFLYYTDVLSTTFVLLMYLFILKGSPFWSALAGFVSLSMRQTNITWVTHCLMIAVESCVKSIRKRTSSKDVLKEESIVTMFKETLTSLGSLWNEGGEDLEMAVYTLINVAEGYLIVIFSFIGFVLMNGGIVAGDKSAHVSGINIPQIFYFMMFFVFFTAPYAVTLVNSFINLALNNKCKVTAAVLVCVLAIYLNTEVHPYLLADNRHYTFYIWRRVYERHYLCKYLMAGVYLFGAHVVYTILRTTEPLFRLGFLIFVFLSLVPQKLLEFRYFIIPFLLLRLRLKMSKWQLALELLFFIIVNYITIDMFIMRTFNWPNSNDVQRFLW